MKEGRFVGPKSNLPGGCDEPIGEDRPLRARWRPVARELDQDFVLEETGQTMHFFSEPYLRELLQDWTDLRLEPVEITRRESGEKFKQVWRGIALRGA